MSSENGRSFGFVRVAHGAKKVSVSFTVGVPGIAIPLHPPPPQPKTNYFVYR